MTRLFLQANQNRCSHDLLDTRSSIDQSHDFMHLATGACGTTTYIQTNNKGIMLTNAAGTILN